MTRRLAGQVAVVTGGSAGIGRATCLALAGEGASVVAVGRNGDRLAETVALVEALGERGGARAVGWPCDVGSEPEVRGLADRVVGEFGRIDVLVCSAGVLRPAGEPLRPVARMPLRSWEEVLRVNLTGTFLCNRAVLPVMISQGRGDVVNLSSMAARLGFAFDAPYCASKCGVLGLTEALAEEVRPHGVRVQALVPGAFATALMHRRWNPAGGEPTPSNGPPRPNAASMLLTGLGGGGAGGPRPGPDDLPPPGRVADLIVQMVTMPPDTRLLVPTIKPLGWPRPSGWRGARSAGPEGATEATRARRAGPAGTGADQPPEERPMSQAEASRTARLEGKVVIVTGGTGGIGLATCRAAAREGAAVVVADLHPQRVAEAVRELTDLAAPPAGHLGVPADVRVEADTEDLARATLERFGRIDALVACAGILRKRGTPPRPVVKTSVEEWDEVLDVNLKGTFLSDRAVLPAMIRQRRGTIINLSSVSGLHGRANDGPYCASKFGVIGLSQSVAEEVKGYGVKVQTLIPDAVDTPLWEQNHPVPRPGDALAPERVADLILFMLTQPEDTILVGPVIAPLGARRRKPGGKPPGEEDRVAPEPNR